MKSKALISILITVAVIAAVSTQWYLHTKGIKFFMPNPLLP